MTSRTVTSRDGVRLSVQERGTADGPAILFLHGINQCHLSWTRQVNAPELEGFRRVTMDLRGHGASDKPDRAEAYGDERWADDIAAVIEAAGLTKPVVVAWSYAGRVITDYLRKYGTSAIGAINLVDASLISDSTMLGPDRRHLIAMQSDDLVTNIESTTGFLRACFVKQPPVEDFQTMLAFNMVVPPAIRKLMIARSVNEGDMLPRIDVPVLLSHGSEDGLLLPSMSRYAADRIPNAKLSIYDGIGHSPFYEDAPRYNRELADFVMSSTR